MARMPTRISRSSATISVPTTTVRRSAAAAGAHCTQSLYVRKAKIAGMAADAGAASHGRQHPEIREIDPPGRQSQRDLGGTLRSIVRSAASARSRGSAICAIGGKGSAASDRARCRRRSTRHTPVPSRWCRSRASTRASLHRVARQAPHRHHADQSRRAPGLRMPNVHHGRRGGPRGHGPRRDQEWHCVKLSGFRAASWLALGAACERQAARRAVAPAGVRPVSIPISAPATGTFVSTRPCRRPFAADMPKVATYTTRAVRSTPRA